MKIPGKNEGDRIKIKTGFAGADMTGEQMAEAVRLNAGRAKLEARGGITLERLPRIDRLGFKRENVSKILRKIVEELPVEECSSENLIRRALQAPNT